MAGRNMRLLRVSRSVAKFCVPTLWALVSSVQLQPPQPVDREVSVDLKGPALSSYSSQQEPGMSEKEQSHTQTVPEPLLHQPLMLLLSGWSHYLSHTLLWEAGEPQQSPLAALRTFPRLSPHPSYIHPCSNSTHMLLAGGTSSTQGSDASYDGVSWM